MPDLETQAKIEPAAHVTRPALTEGDLSVVLYDQTREQDWNTYIESSAKTVFAHHLSWKRVIEESFGHSSYYLMAYRGDDVAGILPLFFVKSLFFGSYLVTAPFLTYGGLVSDDEAVASVLTERATELARDLGADYIEIRNDENHASLSHTKDDYYTLVLDLQSGEADVWNSKLKSTARRNVRKAQKSGLTVVEENELVDEYYRINAKNMHRLGTPAHSLTFFSNIVKYCPGTRLLMLQQDKQFIGGTLLVSFKNSVLMPWVGSLEEYFAHRPNNLIYWESVRWAINNGFQYFDFGRSKYGSGTFRFKAQYGAEPVPLFYQYHLNKAKSVPEVDPDDDKYGMLIKIWRKLPLPVVNFLSPMIIRGIA